MHFKSGCYAAACDSHLLASAQVLNYMMATSQCDQTKRQETIFMGGIFTPQTMAIIWTFLSNKQKHRDEGQEGLP